MITLGQKGKIGNKQVKVVQIHDFGPGVDYYMVGFEPIKNKKQKSVFGRSYEINAGIIYHRILKTEVKYVSVDDN